MNQYDVVIIGGGIGGLQCGYILSKKGYNVCILEKNPQLGGSLQTFKREDVFFDTGFHFTGALDEGQPLNKLFRFYNLLDLPWHKLDENGFAEIVLKDKSYFLATGHERFVDTLAKEFPHQHQALRNYTSSLKQVGETLASSLQFNQREKNQILPLLEKSAYQFLQDTIQDDLLRNVLSGNSLTMKLSADKLPFYTFAQINNSFIQSCWRLKGGGSLITDKLAKSIKQMGGTIIRHAKVNRLISHGRNLVSAEYNDNEQLTGKYFISAVHPALTLSMINDNPAIRSVYRKRIINLSNIKGVFTLHLVLRKNSVFYKNRNVYIYKNSDLWKEQKDANTAKFLVSYQVPVNDNPYCNNIDILTPMDWSEVSSWENTTVGNRGENYQEFKQRKAESILEAVLSYLPELKGNIENYYTSTPLTYRDYTGTWQGSAYGIEKDYKNILTTFLTPQTPVPNLFLTGQNINLHGISGVSVTSLQTCSHITDIDDILNEIA